MVDTPDSLESLYEQLESEAINPTDAFEIARRFRTLADACSADDEILKKANWEIAAFNFGLRVDGVEHTFTVTDECGERRPYPSYDVDLADGGLEYLAQRLQCTGNSALRARYAHVLWYGPKKHEDFRDAAVEAHLELIRVHEKRDAEEPGQFHGLVVLDCVLFAHRACKKGSEREKPVLAEISRLVQSYDYGSRTCFKLRHDLIEFILRRPKLFQDALLSALPGVIDKVNERLLHEGRHHNIISMLELGEKLAQLRAKDSVPWRRRIAESYETMMEQRKDDGWVAQTWCLEAVKVYRSIGDDSKAKELEAKLPGIVQSAELHETRIELDRSKIMEVMEDYEAAAESVSGHSGEDIVKYLMLSSDLLPQKAEVERIVDAQAGKSVFAELCSTQVLDERGNVAMHCDTPEEKRAHDIMQTYARLVNLRMLYINMIVAKSVRRGNLSADTVLEFVGRHSWLTTELLINVAGPRLTYRWIDAIEPGIREYFSRIAEHVKTGADLWPILAVDSLVLKIEGMVRDLCKLFGGSTGHQTRDHKGRTISREKDLDRLLHDDVLTSQMDDDTVLFFRFLLVDQSGFKLRHNIAHGLQVAPQYGLGQAHLLLLAILRLARHQLADEEGAEASANGGPMGGNGPVVAKSGCEGP